MINPSLIIGFLQAAAEESPELLASLKKLFSKPDPTAAEWAQARRDLEALDYDTLVPAGKELQS